MYFLSNSCGIFGVTTSLSPLLTFNICLAISLSTFSSGSSMRTKIKSNLLSNVGGRSICSDTLFILLNLPCFGFAAAITVVLAFSVAVMPAFDRLIVCCSRASWITLLSLSLILSSSSINA
ncbi:120aa long hypothetical protein [Pyrococcus horikoshii OT3]|uniref:Uncharacterized protein n=1 Tax=Pyrococcus horikoshii (strain ATCC 700860 / DSM 12428 / JCM 9974 / NBRC 100139 / OT-3) TaxID=70601 RepID=O58311_PYRHO|nr:120aa long hypothetical protein [Pyrococcus horikoshii OT3]